MADRDTDRDRGKDTYGGGRRYRANPNYLRNPKFCVGCFEFYLSKILRQHLKQGKKYSIFAIFFCGTHFCGAY